MQHKQAKKIIILLEYSKRASRTYRPDRTMNIIHLKTLQNAKLNKIDVIAK